MPLGCLTLAAFLFGDIVEAIGYIFRADVVEP
jgi:hypothetical protein